MTLFTIRYGIILLCSIFAIPAMAEQGGELEAESVVAEGSPFSADEITEFVNSDFVGSLIGSESSLAFGDEVIEFWSKQAEEVHANLVLDQVSVNQIYDVVLQAGHFPRSTGRTGGQGEHVSEQQIAALVASLLRDQLGAAGLKVALVGADNNPNLRTKIFLSLHTDGSETACSVGPSIGYDDASDAGEMKYIAAALAISLGYDLEDFMRDNYTANLRGYYGFSLAETEVFEGVLEMAELSCLAQEENLIGNIPVLALNLFVALQFALKSPEL